MINLDTYDIIVCSLLFIEKKKYFKGFKIVEINMSCQCSKIKV